MVRCVGIGLGLAISLWSAVALSAEVIVAVAANFNAPMQKIAQAFELDTGHKAILSAGSTGSFYAQIKHGAPFDVLLSADEETPRKLEQEHLGVSRSRFTYAVGKLVVWSKQPGLVDGNGEVLRRGHFQKLALANPKLAPYGAAAVETLTRLGLWQTLQPKLVQGDNIAQTYQFIATENAQIGFVALSQVMTQGKITYGSVWRVPDSLYTPIRQDAVLLTKGRDNPAAHALWAYLRSDKATTIIRSFGYDL